MKTGIKFRTIWSEFDNNNPVILCVNLEKVLQYIYHHRGDETLTSYIQAKLVELIGLFSLDEIVNIRMKRSLIELNFWATQDIDINSLKTKILRVMNQFC